MADDLRALAGALGIEPGYWDVAGTWHEPSDDALLALVAVLGWPVAGAGAAAAALAELGAQRARRLLEPVLLVPSGHALELELRHPPSDVVLHLEGGAEADVEVRPGSTGGSSTVVASVGPLPVGYHDLEVSAAGVDGSAVVIVHPSTVRSPRAYERAWGVFAPLHGLAADPVYADLDRLGEWASSLGGAVVATLPLLATFPWDPSPYAPISRSAWATRYVDAARSTLPDWRAALAAAPVGADDVLARWGLAGDAWAPVVDWAGRHPEAVDLAQFRARAALVGGGWRHPGFERVPDDVTLAGEGGAPGFLVDQFLAHQQLRGVASRLRARDQRLYLDLPLGSHPDGWDTWRSPGLFAAGATAGAPPDEFFSGGQDWGFPPVLPSASRADGHRQLRHDLAHQMGVAGMLRIDHVMQLHRLFWIPQGFDGAHGAYVRAPHDELFAVLAVESTRHDCLLVGEDLGTVPDEVRRALDEHDMCGMWVAEFSMDAWPGAELRLPGRRTVASVDTHDTPTLAGWRAGRDLDLLDGLGLLDHEAAVAARSDRAQQVENLLGWLGARGHLPASDPGDEVDDVALHAGLLEALGESDAEVVLVTVEDLWGETEPQNVPGTPSSRPNWVQRLRVPGDELPGYLEGAQALRRLDAARARSASGTGPLGEVGA